MKKLGKIITDLVGHQLCYAHAVQLAINDSLYDKKNAHEESLDQVFDPAGNHLDRSNQDEMLDDLMISLDLDEEKLSVKKNYMSLLNKIRKVVKIFNKPAACEILDAFVSKKFGTIIRLQYDTPTRWTSMYEMISKFIKIYDSIEQALISCKQQKIINITESEVLRDFNKEILEAPCKSLELMKILTEELSSKDCDLLSADDCKELVLSKLNRLYNPFAEDLVINLNRRFDERDY